MIPQMSVLPSRPLATKTSGGRQPVARRAVASADSSLHTRPPSEARLRLCTGGHVDAAVSVDQEPTVGRILNGVTAVSFGEGNQAGAVEIDTVVMNEIGIFARVLAAGAKPNLALGVIDLVDAAHDVRPRGDDIPELAGICVDQIKVPPAVALGDVNHSSVESSQVTVLTFNASRWAVQINVLVFSSIRSRDSPVRESTSIKRNR